MILRKFMLIRRLATAASTVDAHEVQQFQQFVSEWWNEFGPMKALHSMNKLRVPLVRDGMVNTGTINSDAVNTPTPLKNLKILDVGCGGGILSEPLARLGADVTGIDANPNIINSAKCHAESSNLHINYVCSSIEDYCGGSKEIFDAVVGISQQLWPVALFLLLLCESTSVGRRNYKYVVAEDREKAVVLGGSSLT